MTERQDVPVLAQLPPEAAPLLELLGRCAQLKLQTGDRLGGLQDHRVVLHGGDRPLRGEEAQELESHLDRGGGVVLLGPALQAWARHPRLAELVGWVPAEISPWAELRLRPVPGAPTSSRLGNELFLYDRLPLGEPAPPDARVLLTVSWRFGEQVAAFERRIGRGRLVYLGLGWGSRVYAEPDYQRLVHRCLRAAAGLGPAPPIGVGLYGYGAIGREHASAVEAVEGLELRAVCDRAPQRRTEAASLLSAPVHAESKQLLADPSVEVVVVGVPPALHAGAVLECLEAGKHVVCEKPFALRTEEVERMLAAAGAGGRVLTVYQSRRWDPDFVALRAAVRSGAIGHPFYLESFIGGFSHPCSYWHSHEPVSGGTIFDWGAHYFDWILQLLEGEVVGVSAHAHKRVWHDVTNADQVRVDLTFAGGEQATFLQSDIAAAPKPKWYVLGTLGAAVGEWRQEFVRTRAWSGELVEERLQPAEAPAVVTLHRPDGSGGTHVERLSLPPRPEHAFYRNLADHLLLGEPLAVTPEEAARNVALMEAATRSIAAGGRRLAVKL